MKGSLDGDQNDAWHWMWLWDLCSEADWKVKPVLKCLKPASSLMACRGQLHQFDGMYADLISNSTDMRK